MMKSVLKTLAISFGGGLALGAGMRLAQGPAKGRSEPRADLDPLLARLKNVESRIVEMESTEHVPPVASAPAPAIFAEKIFAEKTLAAFESRLAAQLTDVEQLRVEIRQVDERLGELDVQLPVLIQSTVDVRFREVEQNLQREFEEAQNRSMAAFVDTLQTKVVERISTLETNLAEQSQVIGKLRDSSVRSDENLQKMLAGIERLVDQSKAPQPPPAPTVSPPPSPAPEPVVAHAEASEENLPPFARFTRGERQRPMVEERSFPAQQVAAAPPIVEEQKAEEPAPALVLIKAEEPALISDAAQLEKMAPRVSVLGCVPEIKRSGEIEAQHANGAVPEPVVRFVDVTESHAPDSLPSPQPRETGETHIKAADESYEWVNRIGLELLAPHPKPRKAWRVPMVVGVAAALLILIVGLFYRVYQQYYHSGATQPQTST